VLNANDKEKTIDTAPFAQPLKKFTKGKDVTTDQEWQAASTLKILPWTVMILALE